jgi:hypothetical protein
VTTRRDGRTEMAVLAESNAFDLLTKGLGHDSGA